MTSNDTEKTRNDQQMPKNAEPMHDLLTCQAAGVTLVLPDQKNGVAFMVRRPQLKLVRLACDLKLANEGVGTQELKGPPELKGSPGRDRSPELVLYGFPGLCLHQGGIRADLILGGLYAGVPNDGAQICDVLRASGLKTMHFQKQAMKSGAVRTAHVGHYWVPLYRDGYLCVALNGELQASSFVFLTCSDWPCRREVELASGETERRCDTRLGQVVFRTFQACYRTARGGGHVRVVGKEGAGLHGYRVQLLRPGAAPQQQPQHQQFTHYTQPYHWAGRRRAAAAVQEKGHETPLYVSGDLPGGRLKRRGLNPRLIQSNGGNDHAYAARVRAHVYVRDGRFASSISDYLQLGTRRADLRFRPHPLAPAQDLGHTCGKPSGHRWTYGPRSYCSTMCPERDGWNPIEIRPVRQEGRS
jgi:hypothetical protein